MISSGEGQQGYICPLCISGGSSYPSPHNHHSQSHYKEDSEFDNSFVAKITDMDSSHTMIEFFGCRC